MHSIVVSRSEYCLIYEDRTITAFALTGTIGDQVVEPILHALVSTLLLIRLLHDLLDAHAKRSLRGHAMGELVFRSSQLSHWT